MAAMGRIPYKGTLALHPSGLFRICLHIHQGFHTAYSEPMKSSVDLLILGAGWSSTFLIPLCDERRVTHAATSRAGRDGTIPFTFDPDSDDTEPYSVLPDARTILITFPIDKSGASERLVRLYAQSRGKSESSTFLEQRGTRFIQLGTTSMWDAPKLTSNAPTQHSWYDRHSAYISTPRVLAEEELLALLPTTPTTVLNLSGLWGGPRNARNWVGRLTPTKEALKNKGSLHVIHGLDVARCILAVHDDFDKASGQRWLLTDGRVYDWWDLASAWGKYSVPPKAHNGSKVDAPTTTNSAVNSKLLSISSVEGSPQATWTFELMEEAGIRSLPRNVELLGRALDSREFWTTFGITPLHPRLEE